MRRERILEYESPTAAAKRRIDWRAVVRICKSDLQYLLLAVLYFFALCVLGVFVNYAKSAFNGH